MDGRAPPVIDFGPFYGGDPAAKKHLVAQVRAACLEKGFFQLTNHGVSVEWQDAVLEQARQFFALPLEQKMEISLKSSPHNRGYEPLRSQSFSKTGPADLKEGFYLGRDLAPTHPSVVQGKFNMGPNQYPSAPSSSPVSGLDPREFRRVVDAYFEVMVRLARRVLRVLALTLELEEEWFDRFAGAGDPKGDAEGEEPMAVLRLLHYPAHEGRPADGRLENGIGAHTDFGAVTLLLQDDVGGLQVFDAPSEAWIDVRPVPGALVVNLGNLMMRWSNDRYISNLHRVINTSGRERYSVPFFFSGNPDFVVECLPTCRENGAKYPPVAVSQWMQGRYADTYGEKEGEKGKAVPELSKFAIKAR